MAKSNKGKRVTKPRHTAFRLLLLVVAGTVAAAGYIDRDNLPQDIARLEEAVRAILNPPQAGATSVDASSPESAFKNVGGFPRATKSGIVTLVNTGYAVGYDTGREDPLWAVYYCGPEKTFDVQSRKGIRFTTDKRLPDSAQLSTKDYTRPKGSSPTYDRGHMAPNYAIASRYGNDAQIETFLLSNITPQRSTLNQQTWRYLETAIVNDYAPEMDGVWVTVGPIFNQQDTERYNEKAVIPEAFYCIVLDRDEKDGSLNALALELNQSVSGTHKMQEYETTIRQIEQDTGLDFFSALPDDIENHLETTPAAARWDTGKVLKGN